MGYIALYFGNNTKFQRNISSPSSGSKRKPNKKPEEAGITLLVSIFDPGDGGNMFFRNVGLPPN
jgi:hypothetical protein